MKRDAREHVGECGLCGLGIHEDRHLLRADDRLFHFCCTGCRQAFVISRGVVDAEFLAAVPLRDEDDDL